MSKFVEETKFKYYATKDNLLVYGFDDVAEAKQYCIKYNFKLISILYLKKINFDYNNINNWTDTYPEF